MCISARNLAHSLHLPHGRKEPTRVQDSNPQPRQDLPPGPRAAENASRVLGQRCPWTLGTLTKNCEAGCARNPLPP